MKLLSASLLLAFCLACGSPDPPKNQEPLVLQGEKLEEALVQVNKRFLKEEDLLIDRFIERRGWEPQETGTGLRIVMLKEGHGNPPKSGQMVRIDYEVRLLDGTLCYASKENQGFELFRVDYDEVESGIHEGIKYIPEGGRAYLFMPSHRAFGLVGDRNKIPPYNPVWYDITLIEILP